MNMKIKRNTILKFMFFLLFLFTCFQNFTLINFGEFGFKYSHFMSLFFLPLLLKKGKIKIPIASLNIFMIFVIVFSIIMIPFNSFNSLLFNYIFSYYYLIIIGSIGEYLDFDDWTGIIKSVAEIVIIATVIKIIINIDLFVIFFKNPANHPMIKTFFGGGVNLEATWIGLFGFFFIGDKKGYIYSILSIIIAVLYASRVGIIVSVFLLLFMILQKNNIESIVKRQNRIIIGFILGIFAFVFAFSQGYLDYIINRFADTGEDTGSQGRLAMWQYLIPAFLDSPFGVGLGNGMQQLEKVSGVSFPDGNMHNLIFQMLVETGVVGLILYLNVVFKFIKAEYKNFFCNPCIAYIISYLILSLIQFRGGDALLFFVIGVYLQKFNKKKVEEKKNA